ncbi:MAG TPA: DUF4112 domain-containing protein [Cytophagaceae bacterium]
MADVKSKHDLHWLEQFSRLLDSQFTIPGTKIRFGLDPIIGLIPGLGDAAGYILSFIMLAYMTKYGIGGKALFKMLGNILLDAIIGSIPVLGILFDVGYKANDRNVKILKEYYQEGKHQGSGKGIIITIILIFIVFLVLILYGIYKLFEYIIG